MLVDVDTVGAYVVFWYDEDDYGDFVIVDEIWRSSFDECLDEVRYSWGLPFEICQCLRSLTGLLGYKTVARSACFAQIYE